MPLTHQDLPVETWTEIMRYLSPQHTTSCLRVCRFLRRLALRKLFSTTHIYFGSWESTHPDYKDSSRSNQELQIQANSIADALLDRVIGDDSFALLIQRLVIHAYVGNVDAGPLHNKFLRALSGMPNLHALYWLGVSPDAGPAVIEVLSRHCPKLDELRIPASSCTPRRDFSVFDHLSTFSVLSIRNVDNQGGYWMRDLDASLQEIRPLVHASAATLRRLCVFDALLAEISDTVLRQLRVLDVWGPRQMRGLERVFVRGDHLHSLSLVELTNQSVFHLLEANATALPRLTSLKVMSIDPCDAEEVPNALAFFLLKNRQIRRFDVNLPGLSHPGLWQILASLWTLDAVEVVGFDLRPLTDVDDMVALARELPDTLTAVHIQTCWENLPVDAEETRPLLQKLGSLPRLELAHLQTPFTPGVRTALNVAREVPQLSFLALGNDCWAVEDAGADIELRQWSRRRVVFRTEADFPKDDWAWLLRWHGLHEDMSE